MVKLFQMRLLATPSIHIDNNLDLEIVDHALQNIGRILIPELQPVDNDAQVQLLLIIDHLLQIASDGVEEIFFAQFFL